MTLNTWNIVDFPVARNTAQSSFLATIVRTIIFLLFVTVSHGVLAEENLQEATSKYEIAFRSLIELNDQLNTAKQNSSEELNLIDQANKLDFEVERLSKIIIKYGGDIDKINEQINSVEQLNNVKQYRAVKIKPEGKTTVKLDGKDKEYKNPKCDIPWPVKNWPINARAMHDKEFMIRLRILEYSATGWARDSRHKFERKNGYEMKTYLAGAIKKMYQQIEGTTWAGVLKQHPGLEKDVNRFTTGWVEGKFKDDIIREVFDAHGMGESKSKFVDWYWLESVLRITHVRRAYEGAQKNLCDVLLESYGEWDSHKAIDWNVRFQKYANIIIKSERRMVWLLGYSDDKKLQRLENAENFKATELSKAQKELLNAYLQKRWFDLLEGFVRKMPTGGDVNSSRKTAQAKKTYEILKKKYKTLYEASEIKLEENRTKVDHSGKHMVMKSGIYRAFDLGLMDLHIKKESDDIYKKILGDDEYDRLKKKKHFRVLKPDIVYMEFFENDPEKIKNFKAQRKLRLDSTAQFR